MIAPVEIDNWEFAPSPTLPPRSRLYHVAPIGVGSEMVESLSGYICRLAEYHNLQPAVLVTRVMAPLASVSSLHCGALREECYILKANAGTSVSSSGDVCSDAIRITEELTKQANLSRLTAQFTGYVLSPRDLLGTQKWCPCCFHDWRAAEKPIYLPLLWQFQHAKVCSIHDYPLQERCDHCGKPHSPMHRWLQPGYCPSCHDWLGAEYLPKPPARWAVDYDHVATRHVENLIRHAELIESGARDFGWHRSINWIIHHWFPHSEGFGRAVGINPSTVRGWMSGVAMPSLGSVINVAFQLRLRVNDLLLGRTNLFETLHPRRKLRPLNIERKRNQKHDLAKLKQAMEEAATGSLTPPPSLTTISRQTKVHLSFLSRKFPALAKQIKEKHQEYQRTMVKLRLDLIDATVRETMAKIVEGGHYPGRVRMKKALPRSISLFDKVASAAWKDELRVRKPYPAAKKA